MNTSLGWLAFGRVRDHPLSTRSIAHRIEPCRTLIFDLSPEDVVTRRREAERISASGTPLSVHGLAVHICLIKRAPQRSCGVFSTPKIKRLSAGRSRCCRDAAMIVGVRPRIRTVAVRGEMSSVAIPNAGGTMTVLPRLPEVTLTERLSAYIGLYGTSLVCYRFCVKGLQVRYSHVDYLVMGVTQLKLEGR
jgi:hypothetical protein